MDFSYALEHHVSLLYGIADFLQQQKIYSFIFNRNLFLRNNSPHFLNLNQPILALAVTAASEPPLAFSFFQIKFIHCLYLITQLRDRIYHSFLILYILSKQNALPIEW